MKKRPIFTFFFSAIILPFFAQEKTQKSWNYQPNFVVGVDVLNAGLSPFSDRQLFQGFVSSNIKGKIHAIVEAGYDKNKYQKNGYDVKINGTFLKLGGFYMLVEDKKNKTNGFYAGAKFAGSVYQQEYLEIPVRGYAGSSSSVALSPSTQSSYWGEAVLGGRVQLFQSSFYIDVNVQPKYLIYSTKQEDVQPMIVSGFGRSSSKFTMGFSWNIAYQF